MAKRVGSRGRALLGAADLAVMARSGSDLPRSRRMRLLVSLLGALVLASGLGIAPAQAIEPVERGWKGKTSQGLPVYFGVRHGRVINTRYKFRWGFCGVFGSHAKRARLAIDPAGHWGITDLRGSSFEGTFVAPSRVEGMVAAVEREHPGCPEVQAPFVAWPRRR